jgi:cell division cycle 14
MLVRTGTLIAIWMMKKHGWLARESIGWLRIVRPGSVLGPQQQYLDDCEQAFRTGKVHLSLCV